MGKYHDDAYKSTIYGSYYPSDVEKVEKLVNGQWQKVSLDGNDDNQSRMVVNVKQKK